MPMYTYYCKACDSDKEMLSKIADRDNQICSDCGHRLVRGLDKPGMVWAPTRGGSGYAT